MYIIYFKNIPGFKARSKTTVSEINTGNIEIKIHPYAKKAERSEILLYLQVNKLAFQFPE